MTIPLARGWLAGFAALTLMTTLGGCAPQATTKPGQPSASATDAQASNGVAEGQGDDSSARFSVAMERLKTDPAQAQAALESLAMEGYGDAAYQMGLLQTDAQRRVEWHAMAATVGQVDAQYALGEAYLNGVGTAREPSWGLSWFERAARSGQARAQYAVGLALAGGMVGPQQREEGLVWLMIAEKNGVSEASLPIAILKTRISDSALAAIQDRVNAWTNEAAGDAEDRATVRFAQYALGRLGYDAGLPDGLRGERTDQAVSAFRKAQGLGAGGLDGRALDLLRERVAVLNR